MIVTKTPLRVSFFGGGSDIPEFYQNHTGVVVSTAINKPIYLAVNSTETQHTKVSYSEIEVVEDSSHLEHDRVREVLMHFGVSSNIEISSFSQIPTVGTGLGSSSSFTVGLIKAVATMRGIPLNRYELAELACHIEINKCKEPIGKQDQYAAVFGGLNIMYFDKNHTAVVPFNISSQTLFDLKSNLLFFDTGITRKASSVLTNQVKKLKNKTNVEHTKSIVSMAEYSIQLLQNGKLNDFGRLLHDSWEEKKKLSNNVSAPEIDEMYDIAIKNGALGGKILGAGGGGFLMVYVPPEKKLAVTGSLISRYRLCNFDFTDRGCSVEMNDGYVF